jgi:hypothetical protein
MISASGSIEIYKRFSRSRCNLLEINVSSAWRGRNRKLRMIYYINACQWEVRYGNSRWSTAILHLSMPNQLVSYTNLLGQDKYTTCITSDEAGIASKTTSWHLPQHFKTVKRHIQPLRRSHTTQQDHSQEQFHPLLSVSLSRARTGRNRHPDQFTTILEDSLSNGANLRLAFIEASLRSRNVVLVIAKA